VTYPPSGCAWCGLEQRLHFRRWHHTVGWHAWVQPTQQQIKTRMLARRESR
jgi:hypothetical protein